MKPKITIGMAEAVADVMLGLPSTPKARKVSNEDFCEVLHEVRNDVKLVARAAIIEYLLTDQKLRERLA